MLAPLTALVTLVSAALVAAQEPPNPHNVLVKPGLNSTLCLANLTPHDQSFITVELCNSTDTSQIWNFDKGTVRPVNANNTQCLDVKDGDDVDGNLVQLWECVDGNTNQQWYYTGDKRLAWTDHGKCLDLTDGNQAPGTVIKIWTCTDNDDNQVWNTVDAK
ncbi:hypothetical protein EVG20_g7741 [Dentipellis fragilis]|uniref:Ricin B lectin domain-containing protein n=1 Tax=Dentipellis fragilis TaxID=205917 RepID=A0A4Y9YCG4_9AGAM|nr:hypothetical protein EVG20_g7741 [Dentipellis fragilis]